MCLWTIIYEVTSYQSGTILEHNNAAQCYHLARLLTCLIVFQNIFETSIQAASLLSGGRFWPLRRSGAAGSGFLAALPPAILVGGVIWRAQEAVKWIPPSVAKPKAGKKLQLF